MTDGPKPCLRRSFDLTVAGRLAFDVTAQPRSADVASPEKRCVDGYRKDELL